MSYVYLSDLAKEKQTEGFMGKEIMELKEKADKWGCEVIVGEYQDPYLDGEDPEQGKIE